MKQTLILFGALLALAAPALGQGNKTTSDPVRGEADAQRWCASGHLLEGQTKASDTVPAFATIAHDPRKGPEYLRAFLANPHPPMPPLQLSRSEIEDLVAYFSELAKR